MQLNLFLGSNLKKINIVDVIESVFKWLIIVCMLALLTGTVMLYLKEGASQTVMASVAILFGILITNLAVGTFSTKRGDKKETKQ